MKLNTVVKFSVQKVCRAALCVDLPDRQTGDVSLAYRRKGEKEGKIQCRRLTLQRAAPAFEQSQDFVYKKVHVIVKHTLCSKFAL